MDEPWYQLLWAAALAAATLAASLGAAIHVLLHKRDVRAAIGWMGLVWLSPLIGSLLYFCFGVNRIQRKKFLTEIDALRQAIHAPLDSEHLRLRDRLLHQRFPALMGLVELGDRLTSRPLLPGNRIETLVHGDEAYPAMLAAIDAAERSVSLCSYIFDNDEVGQRFVAHLAEAQRRGVAVRVLVDAFGARYSRPTIMRSLAEANLPAARFLPTPKPTLFRYANLRNHRKLLVVDGAVGFTGGTNIRAGHQLNLEPQHPVQCLHFRLAGPIAAHLQEAFATDWAFATDEMLVGEQWFPHSIDPQGAAWCRGISHGPDEDFEKMPLTMLGALAAAQRRVEIVTPYFLPEQPLLDALSVAALRGVEVRIVLPAKNNVPLVQWATQALLEQLLERGCRVWLSAPPFDHTKLFLVDGQWTLLGSTNWDPRSLRLNFEFNVECYDPSLAQRLTKLVDYKIAGGREVTLAHIAARPLPTKLRDAATRLLSPYM